MATLPRRFHAGRSWRADAPAEHHPGIGGVGRSGGYGVVYSEGEIDAGVRTSSTALIAYYDGKGTSLSLGDVSSALRTTVPGNSKGGRYLSNLANVAVATPNSDTV